MAFKSFIVSGTERSTPQITLQSMQLKSEKETGIIPLFRESNVDPPLLSFQPGELLEAEHVVGVVWLGQEVLHDELVHVQGGVDYLADAGIELLAESLGVQVPQDDPTEDGHDRIVRHQVHVQRVKVPHKPA